MRKPIRFRHFLTIVALAACTVASAQNMGITANPGVPAVPNPNAILDMDVSGLSGTTAQPKRGLLIPRMTAAERLAIPVIPADDGLLVYQTDTGTVNEPANQRGFWYYAAAAPAGWVHLSTVRSGWFINGNTVATTTGPFAEFLGTANLSPNRNLVFRTVLAPTAPAMQFGYHLFDYLSGFVGLGTAAPAVERLEVQGAIHLEKNTTPNVAVPAEGTIRYGTKDGLASSTTNLNWHWGTDFDTLGNIRWSRLENAENFVSPPKPYAKDTVACSGQMGDAYRGHLSPAPVTQTASNPVNYYSPFATNFDQNVQGNFRVQYLYRYSELVQAGLCFPATINAISFYCLEQETLGQPGPPLINPTTISGEIRGGAAVNATLANPTTFGYGTTPSAPFMDDAIRTSGIKGNIVALTPSPGWVVFNLATPITLNANENLIIDIVWTRSVGVGVGPKVELEDPGFNCTRWVLFQPAGGTQSALTRSLMDDNGPPSPLPSGAVIGPGTNAHTKRPVTRFSGTVVSPTVLPRAANYIQYDGGLMIGSSAWANTPGNFHGAGTIAAESGIYDAGSLLSDHVFDRYFDGTVRPEDTHAAEGYAYVGLDQLRDRLERDRHLPNMPSRSEWEAKGGASLGTVTTGLWESVEDQALYISQLEKDLSALEELAFGPDLSPQEAQRLIAEVQESKRLTQAQKLHLINALNEKTNSGNPKP